LSCKCFMQSLIERMVVKTRCEVLHGDGMGLGSGAGSVVE
jgi:hypothetical protein